MKIKHPLVSAFILIAATGCSSEIDKAKGEILAGCIQGGATKSVCTCAYNKLVDHYGEEQMAKLAKLKHPGELPVDWIDRAAQAGIACRLE